MDTSETENEKRLMQNAKIDYIDRVLKAIRAVKLFDNYLGDRLCP